ncbi:MAG: hypothetical protein LBS86_04410 [Treponema sp.]|jgi:DNA repair exonuclease SbcCD ATPase subunit|nr:hypothetical protein [Treponema sp.]
MQETAATKPEARKAATLDDVLTVIRDLGESQKETDRRMQETDRRLKELAEIQKQNAAAMKQQWEATDRRIEEHRQATDQQIKEHQEATNKRIEEYQEATNKRIEEYQEATNKRIEEHQEVTNKQIKEHQEATNRQIKEHQEATDKRIEEHRQATDRRMEQQWKETNKKLSEFGVRLGDIVEHLIAPNLIEKFKAMKFTFTTTGSNRKFFDSKTQRQLAEVDVLLENTTAVMAVEVKSKLQASHVEDHVKRMNILRAYADEHGDQRVWLGAVGGAVLSTDARQAAHKAGFYLLEQSGDTMRISVPEDFKPQEWTFGMTAIP